jgi:hypothetical protein
MNAFRTTCTILSISFCFMAIASAEQRPLSGKQLSEVKIFVQPPEGSPVEVVKETGIHDHEMMGVGSNARPSNTAELMRLPGGKSTLRFEDGDNIVFLALLPEGIEPRQFELLHYEQRGKMRIVYLQAFGDRRGSHWNTVSFRAGQLKDGRWKLLPGQLPVGEYCFTPRDSDANFCFGVDPK